MEFTKEQIAQAYACKMPEELLELAKANGVELSSEEAQELFDAIAEKERAEGELADDELEKVAGGKSGCSGRNNYPFVVFPTKEAVTYVANAGDEMQAYVGLLIGNDTATVKILRTYPEYRTDRNGWIDRYEVQKISGSGIFDKEHRHRFEKKS